jgi:hypothetical protein
MIAQRMAARQLALRLSLRSLSTTVPHVSTGGRLFATPTTPSLWTTTTPRFQSTAAVDAEVTQAAAPAPPPAPRFQSTPARQYEYFTNVHVTPEGVAVIKFDCPGKPVNTISFKLADEAKVLWKKEIEDNNAVKAVVFSSAKPNTFIAGADIFDIKAIDNKQDLVPLIADGLAFFQHMRAKKIPLVAAIDGPALGGGLEWALWCDYRICTDNPKTKVGRHSDRLVGSYG